MHLCPNDQYAHDEIVESKYNAHELLLHNFKKFMLIFKCSDIFLYTISKNQHPILLIHLK